MNVFGTDLSILAVIFLGASGICLLFCIALTLARWRRACRETLYGAYFTGILFIIGTVIGACNTGKQTYEFIGYIDRVRMIETCQNDRTCDPIQLINALSTANQTHKELVTNAKE